MQAVGTRSRRQERTRRSILDSALAIVAESGPDALSMRAIADRIDYSAAGLYEYFGSKEEILNAVREEGMARLGATMGAVDPSLPALDYLREIGLAYIRFALANRDHFLLAFTQAPAPVPAAAPRKPADTGDSPFRFVMQGVERALAEGILQARPGMGVLEQAYAAWGLVHGLAMLRMTSLYGAPLELDEADRAALAALLRGFSAA